MEEKKFCLKSKTELDEIRKIKAEKKINETWTTFGSGYVELNIPDEVWQAIATSGDNDAATEEGLKNPSIAKQLAQYEDEAINKAFDDLSIDMSKEDKKKLTRHDKEMYILWTLSWNIAEEAESDEEVDESRINEISDEIVDKANKERHQRLAKARIDFMKKAFDFDDPKRQELQGKASEEGKKALKANKLYKARRFRKEFEGDPNKMLDYIQNPKNLNKLQKRNELEAKQGHPAWDAKLGKTENYSASEALEMSKKYLGEVSDETVRRVGQKRDANLKNWIDDEKANWKEYEKIRNKYDREVRTGGASEQTRKDFEYADRQWDNARTQLAKAHNKLKRFDRLNVSRDLKKAMKNESKINEAVETRVITFDLPYYDAAVFDEELIKKSDALRPFYNYLEKTNMDSIFDIDIDDLQAESFLIVLSNSLAEAIPSWIGFDLSDYYASYRGIRADAPINQAIVDEINQYLEYDKIGAPLSLENSDEEEFDTAITKIMDNLFGEDKGEQLNAKADKMTADKLIDYIDVDDFIGELKEYGVVFDPEPKSMQELSQYKEEINKRDGKVVFSIDPTKNPGQLAFKFEGKKMNEGIDKDSTEIKIFLTNLGKYNEGELVGEWVTLPVDDFKPILDKIGINDQYEEYFITDYEAPFEIGEYDDIKELNEIAEDIQNFNETEAAVLRDLVDTRDYDVKEAVEKVADGDYLFVEGDTKEDLAYNYIDMLGGLSPDFIGQDALERYFDYGAYGRDLILGGDYVEAYDDEGNFIGYEDNEGNVADVNSEEDLAYYVIDDIYGDISELSPNELISYFDYEAYGRDLAYDFDQIDGGWVNIN